MHQGRSEEKFFKETLRRKRNGSDSRKFAGLANCGRLRNVADKGVRKAKRGATPMEKWKKKKFLNVRGWLDEESITIGYPGKKTVRRGTFTASFNQTNGQRK